MSGCSIRGSAEVTPGNKTRKWLEGIVGKALPEGLEEVDVELFKGRKCRIVTSVGVGSKGGEFTKIESIAPFRDAEGNPPTKQTKLDFD